MGKTKTAFIGEGIEEKKEHKKPSAKPEKVHIAGLKGGQRIKTIESEPLPQEASATEGLTAEGKEKKAKAPKVRGKKYQEAKTKINPANLYSLPEAIKLAKETSYSKFDGSLELHLVLKKIGVSANVKFPFSAGKEKKIEIADDTTVVKLKEGKIDFDILLATAEMMPKLVPFARILGPRGLMPNPKNGTLISDPKKAKAFSPNSITVKTEKEAPLIHTVFGKVSQPEKELVENAEAILTALGKDKQIVKAFTKASMGPSVKIKI